MHSNDIVMKAYGITKEFPGVIALDSVNLNVQKGTVHCIIGENGAGKSTLVKILTGLYIPNAGTLDIGGRSIQKNRSAFELVSYVPQEIDLFQDLSVAENLFMPFFKCGMKGAFISKKVLYEKSKKYLNRFQIPVNPEDSVKNISISNQQLLQIARAATREHFKVLILDEPTTSLTNKETKVLFHVIKELKASGIAIIFISHKLDEIFDIGDYVTVLRNGKLAGESPIIDTTKKWIISKMSGEEIDIDEIFRPKTKPGHLVLQVDNLSGDCFNDISFSLHKGEVLGFSGLIGAGRTELMQTIFGYRKKNKGRINYLNCKWKGKTHKSVKNGMVYIPEERKQQGILPTLSVRDNIGISNFSDTSKYYFISNKKEELLVNSVIEDFDVKTSTLDKKIIYLSGGNQQKAIIGRATKSNPDLLIFDEPTKGIDVKTKVEIHRLIKKLAEENQIAIILISSEMDEIFKCSSRIITLYQGEITGRFNTEQTNKTQILSAMIGAGEKE